MPDFEHYLQVEGDETPILDFASALEYASLKGETLHKEDWDCHRVGLHWALFRFATRGQADIAGTMAMVVPGLKVL